MMSPDHSSEKMFIRQVLAQYATTAKDDAIDDCIIIDTPTLLGQPDLPYIVYSMDHPSRIKRPLPQGMAQRFYGRWIAGCTCGDVIAMGAQVKGFALDLALPADRNTYDVEALYDGLHDVVAHYGGRIEGGNIDVGTQYEVVGMSWGIVPPEALIRRSGARVGDYIALTTPIGIGWASYLLHRYDLFEALSADLQEAFRQYNVLPVAPAAAIQEAAQHGAFTSGMDLTDGPVEFFHTIAERNGLGVKINEAAFPIHPLVKAAAQQLQLPPQWFCLDPGYDTPRSHGYTVRAEQWETVQAIFKKHDATIYTIGEVTAQPTLQWIRKDGSAASIPPFWDDQFDKANLEQRWRDFAHHIHITEDAQ